MAGSFALVAGATLAAVSFAVGCSATNSTSLFGTGGSHGDSSSSSNGSSSSSSSNGSNGSGGSIFVNSDGGSSGEDGGTSGDACAPNLTGRLRDFVNKPGFTPASALDDDFENAIGDDRGIVATDLDSTSKPVYAHPGGTTLTTHGQTQFDWWYRDTPGINIPFDYAIVLTPIGGGISSFDNQEFFPLDGRGWNDEYTADDGNLHNFSFTFELHTTFEYMGGETFTFTGDDDVFVFINNKLVVDLGGVHGAETKAIMLDTLVTDDTAMTTVQLTKGMTYPLDIFYNERHTVSSHFRMDTSITFNNCTPIIIQ